MEQKISLILNLVRGLIVLTFHDIHTIGLWYLVANPTGHILCRRIERQNLVEVAVVETVANEPLDVGEINNHTILIQFTRLAVNGDYPVVSMQLLTLTFVGEIELMAGRDFECFLDVIHRLNFILAQR